MSPIHIHGRDQFVDAVHTQFDAWAEIDELNDAIGMDGLAVLRLAVHEWVANLVQHAEFCGDAELVISLEIVDGGIRCHMEDSSRGFDFVDQIGAQQSVMNAPAPSERGRGLLMLVSCAEDLEFRQADGDQPQHIAFTVRAPTEDTFAGLFRPEDLALDGLDFELSSGDFDAHGDGSSELGSSFPVQQDPLSS